MKNKEYMSKSDSSLQKQGRKLAGPIIIFSYT